MCWITKPTKSKGEPWNKLNISHMKRKNIDVTAVYIINNYGNTVVYSVISLLCGTVEPNRN